MADNEKIDDDLNEENNISIISRCILRVMGGPLADVLSAVAEAWSEHKQQKTNRFVVHHIKTMEAKIERIGSFIEGETSNKTKTNDNVVVSSHINSVTKKGEIPDDAQFSGQILMLTRPASVFSWYLGRSFYSCAEWGQWINKGDIIYGYEFYPHMFKRKTVPIRSPISGLVIWSEVRWEEIGEGYHDIVRKKGEHSYGAVAGHFAILVAKGETPDFDGNELYEELYESTLKPFSKAIKKGHYEKLSSWLSGEYGIDINDIESIQKGLRKYIAAVPSDYIYLPITNHDYHLESIFDEMSNNPKLKEKLKEFLIPKACYDLAVEKSKSDDAIYNNIAIDLFEKALPHYKNKELYIKCCVRKIRSNISEIKKGKEKILREFSGENIPIYEYNTKCLVYVKQGYNSAQKYIQKIHSISPGNKIATDFQQELQDLDIKEMLRAAKKG